MATSTDQKPAAAKPRARKSPKPAAMPVAETPAAEAAAPADDSALKPRKRMPVAEAARVWEDGKRTLERLKAPMEEAEEVLLAHFESTKRETYKRRIGWTWSPVRLIMDQEKVKQLLGDRLPKKRTKRKRTLQLLKDD